MCEQFDSGAVDLATRVKTPFPLNVSAKTFTLYSHVSYNILCAKLQTAQYSQQDYTTICNRNIYMYSLLVSIILVSCS